MTALRRPVLLPNGRFHQETPASGEEPKRISGVVMRYVPPPPPPMPVMLAPARPAPSAPVSERRPRRSRLADRLVLLFVIAVVGSMLGLLIAVAWQAFRLPLPVIF